MSEVPLYDSRVEGRTWRRWRRRRSGWPASSHWQTWPAHSTPGALATPPPLLFGKLTTICKLTTHHPCFPRGDRLLWEGCRENKRCPRDTYPESYITKYTSIRRKRIRQCTPVFRALFVSCCSVFAVQTRHFAAKTARSVSACE